MKRRKAFAMTNSFDPEDTKIAKVSVFDKLNGCVGGQFVARLGADRRR